MNRIIIDLTGSRGLADNHYNGRDGAEFDNLKLQLSEGDYLVYQANNLIRPGYSYPYIDEYSSVDSLFYEVGLDTIVTALNSKNNEDQNIVANNYISEPTGSVFFQAEDGVEIVDAVNYEVQGDPAIVFAALYKEKTDFFNTSEDEISSLTNLNAEMTNSTLPSNAGYTSGIFYHGLYIAPAFSDGLVYSYDGKSWVNVDLSIDRTRTLTETTSSYDKEIVIFGGEGDPILYGEIPEGDFTDVTSGSPDDTKIANILFHDSATGGGFVVGVGFDQATQEGEAMAYANVPSSGTSWDTSLPGSATVPLELKSVAYSPTLDMFVMVGQDIDAGTAKAYYAPATSAGLASPTEISSSFAQSLEVVHWFNGKFWAFDHSNNARLYESTDGINWTANFNFPLVNIVAAADDGYTMALKTDGESPSMYYVDLNDNIQSYNNPPISSNAVSVIAGKGAFVILGTGRSYIVKNDRKQTEATGKNILSVGFYDPATDTGIDQISSKVTEVYPDSYENLYISLGSGQPWESEFDKFYQVVEISDLDERKVGLVRIRMNVHSSDTVNIRVAMHDSTDYTGKSFDATEVAFETYEFTGPTEEKNFDVFVDFNDAQFGENVRYGAIAVSIDSMPTFTSTDFAYIEPVVTRKELSLYQELHASNGGNSDIYGDQSLDISILKNSTSFWTSKFATNARPLSVKKNYLPFIVPADNGFLYIFTGNQVHSLDGGKTGGAKGILRRNLLSFPDYLDIVDAVDRKSRLYMAIQSVQPNRSNDANATNDIAVSSDVCGVYIWDKISLAINYQEFVPIPGVTEIRKLFIDSIGRINAFVVTNDGMTEIRTYSQGEFVTNKVLGQKKYPVLRRNPTYFGPYYTWTDPQGVMHMWGNKDSGTSMEYYEHLDINDMGGSYTQMGNEAVLLPSMVGATNTNQELNVFISNKSSTIFRRAIKPYDYSGSIRLKGKIRTPVRPVNSLSTIKYIRGFHARFQDDKDFVVSPTVKMYVNMDTDPIWTHTITKAEVEKGYFEKEINHQNINFVQFEVEWPESTGDQKIYAPFMFELWNEAESRQRQGR